MKYFVIESHVPDSLNPISVKAGDKVIIGRKSVAEEDSWAVE